MTISFDGAAKIATLSAGTTELSVPDLYSRWKDWVLAGNAQFPEMFRPLGGDPIDPVRGTFIPPYVFLLNGWKIRPQEANHTLDVIDGFLIVDGGGDPFINTVGSFNVKINYQQPVQAVAFSTSGGSGATPSQIASAVWADAQAAAIISANTPSTTEIASAVWNEEIAAHAIAGTYGLLAQQIATDANSAHLVALQAVSLLEVLLKYERNRTKIDKTAFTLTVYDDDGETPIRVFNLKNSLGAPSVTEVTERVPA